MFIKLSITLLLGTSLFAQVPSLSGIHKIYVDNMPNDLDQYVRAEFYKQMRGAVMVVTDKNDADAILSGVSEAKNGVLDQVTGRYLGLHDTSTGSINLYDKSGKLILWSGEAGDRTLFLGNFKRGGERKVAERLIRELKKQMHSDEKREM